MGLGNKLLNGTIRRKIGSYISKVLYKNSITINDLDKNDIVYSIDYDNSDRTNYICKLSNAYIYSTFGYYFNKDKKLIRDLIPTGMFDTLILGGYFAFYPLKKKVYIKGNIFSLQSLWVVSFAHWIQDILPKLFILKDSGLFEKIDTIVLGSGCISSFHRESLKLFGFDDKKIFYIDDEMEVECENLYIPSLPCGVLRPDKWVFIRYNLFAKELFLRNKDNYTFPKKVYLRRKKLKTRNLLNEEELLNLLSKYGYESICLEEHSLEYQFFLFYNVERVISIVGSGLANLICSNKGIKVLGIEPYIRPEENTWTFILENVGGTYSYYTETNKDNFKFLNNHNKNNDFDFKIDIDEFTKVFNTFEYN